MGKLYIFTAGTSLLTNLKLDPTGNAHFTWLSKWLKDRTVERILEYPDENIEAYRRMVSFYSGKTGKETTAELSSFVKLNLQDDDQIVLLASDTSDGIFSTLVIAYLMTEPGSKDPIQLWSTPGNPIQIKNWNSADIQRNRNPDLEFHRRKQVYVMRITGLDPSNEQRFETQAIGTLMHMFARLVKYANGDKSGLDPIIIFTGGFKVSLPVITQAASWLGGIPMYGLHEDSNELIQIPVLKSNISEDLTKAILGWTWQEGRNKSLIEKNYNSDTLSKWARQTKMSWSALEAEFKSAFVSRETGVQLNIIGEAILGVILAKLPVEN